MTDLTPGTQIMYVPAYVNGDLSHPAVERGFVVRKASAERESYFCRYWYPFDPLNPLDEIGLRTTANSESTPIYYITVQDSVPQAMVDRAIEMLKEDVYLPGDPNEWGWK